MNGKSNNHKHFGRADDISRERHSKSLGPADEVSRETFLSSGKAEILARHLRSVLERLTRYIPRLFLVREYLTRNLIRHFLVLERPVRFSRVIS